jgi:ferrous iron transport protein B
MGFIEGKEIEAIKRAPLQDPAEYNIMGYSISLRSKDAEMIEIDTTHNVYKSIVNLNKQSLNNDIATLQTTKNTNFLNVALVGNPNCGKTTIFNFASNSHERVANYTGVTVSAKEATATINDKKIQIIDLPGTYSLSSYSPEELYVIDYLLKQQPDVVVNVIDASNIERNLFLTTQLMDLGVKVVVALNMFDELKENGDNFDYERLSDMIGIPFIPTIGTKGGGIDKLFETILSIHEGNFQPEKRRHLNYGAEIEKAISTIEAIIKKQHVPTYFETISTRFVSLKLIDNDAYIANELKNTDAEAKVQIKQQQQTIEKLYNKDITNLLADIRYGFIDGALKETYKAGTRKRQLLSRKADKLITHTWLGIPLFFIIIWTAFYSTFKIGEIPANWIQNLLTWFSSALGSILPDGALKALAVDGILGGVGGVLVFLPSIMILFLFISLMEETGYMARTAFLMDKIMHKAGLHGKSFIPMLMGFGCNVPAVMATRTIESKRDRILTMLIIPFMSCSARLPVYILFISAFFPFYKGTILFSVYLIGILAAFLTTLIMNRTIFKKTEAPFVMELPPYRIPTLKAVFKHMWFKSSFFLRKMGTIILFASIVIWALGYFPRNKEINQRFQQQIVQTQNKYNEQINTAKTSIEKQTLQTKRDSSINNLELLKQGENLEQSYISRLGKTIEPVFAPIGFDWKMTVSILTGVAAKEIVVSSMGVLYQADNAADENSSSLISKLQEQQKSSGTPLYVYFAFLIFILLYFPCIGTLVAIRKETGYLKWTLFEIFYTTSIAWIVALTITIIGKILS